MEDIQDIQDTQDIENPLHVPVKSGQRTGEMFEVQNNDRSSLASICDDPVIDKVLNVHGLKYEDGTEMVRKAGLVGSTLNLTNSIIGGGILALPYAFSGCGWVLGAFLIVGAGIATAFSLHLLTLCSLKVPPPASFYKVTKASIPQYCFLVDAAVAFQTFGIAVAFLIIVGGLMPDVCAYLHAGPFWSNRHLWVSMGFLIVAPVSCLKTLDALKYTSAFAVFCVAFISLLIFAYAADPAAERCDGGGRDCVGDTELAVVDFNTFKVLGVFINAYSCQMNMFPVVNELKNPTLKRLDVVSFSAIATAFVWYMIVAASGYAVYGAAVMPDVLQNFPATAATTTARLLSCLLVLCSYPLLVLPARTSLMALEALFDPPDTAAGATTLHRRFWTDTAIFLLGSYAIAMITDDLGVVFSLIGATGATIITYILPGAAYYKMHPPGTGPDWMRTVAAGYVVFGCCVMVFCVSIILI